MFLARSPVAFNGRGPLVVVATAFLALAGCQYANTKEKAYVAAMKADLRNLVTAEEAYFKDNVTYASSTANLYYVTSSGNSVRIVEASGTGWSATATSMATGETCAIYVGSASPPQRGRSVEAQPYCR